MGKELFNILYLGEANYLFTAYTMIQNNKIYEINKFLDNI